MYVYSWEICGGVLNVIFFSVRVDNWEFIFMVGGGCCSLRLDERVMMS